MNRNLAMEFVRVTEMAAIASARFMGRGDEKAADQAAVDAMRAMLDSIDCESTVVIGEGERDEAPMLYIGEKIGVGKLPQLEIALDPLEGTTICAMGGPNAISVMAIGEPGCLLHAPDTYMMKIACGPEGKGVIDIRQTPTENLKALADAKKCRISDLTASVLDRPRHKELIEEIRAAGARIEIIGDCDITAAIATATANSGIDILFGIGGAPEGVISAAALQCLGGEFQGILKPRNQTEIDRALKMGVDDINRVFHIHDLAKGNLMFCATGVTTGSFLDGVIFKPWGCLTHSLVMRSESGTIRNIRAEHHFDKKPRY
jgi:fructose-1,6-bisphosphatase class II